MIGRIVYTTTTVTPALSPFASADIFLLNDVFVESISIGGTQDINMYWGYSKLDPYLDDQRNVSQSAAGVVEVTNFLTTEGFKFTIDNVVQSRDALSNEFGVMQALNNELMKGTAVTWYPDYSYSISEYYSCVAKKRSAPKRKNALPLWTFDFDLMILADVQIPSTVPPFTLN